MAIPAGAHGTGLPLWQCRLPRSAATSLGRVPHTVRLTSPRRSARMEKQRRGRGAASTHTRRAARVPLPPPVCTGQTQRWTMTSSLARYCDPRDNVPEIVMGHFPPAPRSLRARGAARQPSPLLGSNRAETGRRPRCATLPADGLSSRLGKCYFLPMPVPCFAHFLPGPWATTAFPSRNRPPMRLSVEGGWRGDNSLARMNCIDTHRIAVGRRGSDFVTVGLGNDSGRNQSARLAGRRAELIGRLIKQASAAESGQG